MSLLVIQADPATASTIPRRFSCVHDRPGVADSEIPIENRHRRSSLPSAHSPGLGDLDFVKPTPKSPA